MKPFGRKLITSDVFSPGMPSIENVPLEKRGSGGSFCFCFLRRFMSVSLSSGDGKVTLAEECEIGDDIFVDTLEFVDC